MQLVFIFLHRGQSSIAVDHTMYGTTVQMSPTAKGQLVILFSNLTFFPLQEVYRGICQVCHHSALQQCLSDCLEIIDEE